MTRISLGDASTINLLARQSAALRLAIQNASNEVATGRRTDLAQDQRGDVAPILAIDASLARLRAHSVTASDAALQTKAQQVALDGMSSLSADITTVLLSARDLTTPIQVDAMGAEAKARLASAIGLLNSQATGRAIFSGASTDTVPLGSVDDLMASLQTASAGATTAGQVAVAVSNWFTDPAGYAAFYQGGSALDPIPVAVGEAAEVSTTALDPAIRDTLAAFATAALLDQGVLSGNSQERAILAQTAGQSLLSSADRRIALAARIGTIEAQIDAARTRNAAEESALGILRSEIGSADPYEAATRLQAAQSQLEALYLVTARVSRLSLMEFLR